MYKDIDEIIDIEFRYVKIDNSLLRNLENFINSWKFKSSGNDNAAFLGTNLLGVDNFSFSKVDDDNFFKLILKSSENKLRYAFHSLKDLNTEFKTSSNPLYLSIVTLMHMVIVSTANKKLKDSLLVNLNTIFGYKCFGSMYNHFFKTKADPAIAKAMYERLTNKYLIKRLGTWDAVFNYRSKDVIEDGIYVEKLTNLTTENAIYVINQIAGSYKSMLKNLFEAYLETKEKNEKIVSDSMIDTIGNNDEQDTTFKDVVNSEHKYVDYIRSIINSENDLIHDDLIYLISRILPSVKEKDLTEMLEIVSTITYSSKPEEDYIERIIISSLNYLRTKNITTDFHKQIQKCLTYLKGYWSAGNIKEPMAKEAKAMANELSAFCLKSTNKIKLNSCAIGFCLYIFALAIYKFK